MLHLFNYAKAMIMTVTLKAGTDFNNSGTVHARKLLKVNCNRLNDNNGKFIGNEGVILKAEKEMNLTNSTVQGRFILVSETVHSKASTFKLNGKSKISAKHLDLDNNTVITGDGDFTISTQSKNLRGKIDVTGRAILELYDPNCKNFMNIKAREIVVRHVGGFENHGVFSVPARVEANLASFDKIHSADKEIEGFNI